MLYWLRRANVKGQQGEDSPPMRDTLGIKPFINRLDVPSLCNKIKKIITVLLCFYLLSLLSYLLSRKDFFYFLPLCYDVKRSKLNCERVRKHACVTLSAGLPLLTHLS